VASPELTVRVRVAEGHEILSHDFGTQPAGAMLELAPGDERLRRWLSDNVVEMVDGVDPSNPRVRFVNGQVVAQ